MKKTRIFTLCAIALSGLLFTQCDFGDINVNPNRPSQADTRFLYIGAIRQALPRFNINDTWDPWTMYNAQYVSEKYNIQFTNFSVETFGTSAYYTDALKNLNRIIEMNTDDGFKGTSNVTGLCVSNANQIAVCRTLKAYIYMHLTDALGMLPYSEALRPEEGFVRPKYDSQQAIYTDLNKELEEAYAQFVEGMPLDANYELMYKGDIGKWKRFNASVRMQLAIKLFKADAASGQSRFARAYNDGFIRNNSDIFQYPYLNETANQNPLFENMMSRRDFWPSATIVDQMKVYNDPRIPAYFAVPENGGDYKGMPFGLASGDATATDAATLSPFNQKYWRQNSPLVLTTPSVILLAAAEAAERGWISATARDLYNEAITVALQQHDCSAADIATYLASSAVAYKTGGSQADRIAQIAMQKWIASYMQDGIEAWSDYRRLGVPDLQVGPNHGTVEAIPRRRKYHPDDFDANPVNHAAAVAAQGPDAMSTRVWWDKE